MLKINMHTIKIEYIADDDYQRLLSEAAKVGLSLRNYTRQKLGIMLAKRGNPHGNKGKKIKQPQRKQAD